MNNLSRREFLRNGLAAGAVASLIGPTACVTTGGQQIKPTSRPNIVFILSDDYGLDGVGCYGSDRHKGRTPNMDALAGGGIRFERCYSTPLCGPTRCEIKYRPVSLPDGRPDQPHRRAAGLKDEYPLARILKEAGYDTCHAGKWRQMGETPGDWGFGEYITDQHRRRLVLAKKLHQERTARGNRRGDLLPGCHARLRGGFPATACAEGLGSAKPFYLYYASHLVHGPILRTPDSKPGSKTRTRSITITSPTLISRWARWWPSWTSWACARTR